jgi:cyclophilin family peptidyl-prolyl cis-trans isomerase/HEAT repeat protein
MRNKLNTAILFFTLIYFFGACVPPEKKEITEVKIDLNDSIYRKILDFQDRRMSDSLVLFLNDHNPTYRYVSTLAFASVQDSNYQDLIVKNLNDKVAEVREAAVYSLGQMASNRIQDSLISVFGKYDTLNPNSLFNSYILEAIGKIGDKKYLKPLATVKSYRPTDTLLILGQTRALYRYITKGISIPEGTEKIIDIVGSSIYPENIKVLGSYYLIRATKSDLSNYKFRLSKLFEKESNPFIKMNLAIALGKTQDSEVLGILLTALKNKNTDNRVKVSIIKAFGNFKYIDVAEDVLKSVSDNDTKVAFAAAGYFYENGEPNDVSIYRKIAKKDTNWIVKSRLYNAILKKMPPYFSKTKAATIWDIKKIISNSENPYEKAEYIRALGNDINSLKLIKELGFQAPEIIIRVASVEALTTLVQRDELTKLPKWRKKKLKEELASIILESFKSGDPGLISSAVSTIEKTKLDFMDQYEKLDFIDKSLKLLTLPKDIEAYNNVLRLRSKISNKKYIPYKIEYNHPIDWNTLDWTTDSTLVRIETNKGEFMIKFFKNQSPGSVVNFIKLVKDHFYDGKIFHRVVPNFVIQTGCPRGDGYGSLNYTIRSELEPLYYDDSGYVGMASAGKDTESTQWFVTLTPTPHLDGRYTIFGKVIKGMDVVNKILISDYIIKAELIK